MDSNKSLNPKFLNSMNYFWQQRLPPYKSSEAVNALKKWYHLHYLCSHAFYAPIPSSLPTPSTLIISSDHSFPRRLYTILNSKGKALCTLNISNVFNPCYCKSWDYVWKWNNRVLQERRILLLSQTGFINRGVSTIWGQRWLLVVWLMSGCNIGQY